MRLILDNLAIYFRAKLRERGATYFRDGRVRLASVAEHEVRATVTGTEEYDVVFRRHRRGQPLLACACPYAEDHGRCKHMWAVLLALQEHHRRYPPGGNGTRPGPDSPERQRTEEKEKARRVRQIRRDLIAELRRPRRGPEGGAAHGSLHQPLAVPLLYQFHTDHLRASGQVLIDALLPADRGRGFTDLAWLRSRDRADRALAHRLLGAPTSPAHDRGPSSRRFLIPSALYPTTLRRLCATGRLLPAGSGEDAIPLRWDDGGAWRPVFAVEPMLRDGSEQWRLDGWLERGEERLELDRAAVVTAHGLLLGSDHVLAPLRVGRGWPLLRALRVEGPIIGSPDEVFALAAECRLAGLSDLRLPAATGIEEVRAVPVPRLRVEAPSPYAYGGALLTARLGFDYDGTVFTGRGRKRGVIDAKRRRILPRDRTAERAARDRLRALGATTGYDWRTHGRTLQIPKRRLQEIVHTLVREGWYVEAEGRRYRAPSATHARVESGIDWFELQGGADYDGLHASLPALLAARQRGATTIRLDDGSEGLLPLEWLERYVAVGALASTDDGAASGPGALRFRRGQAALLDALLATQPEVIVDATFRRVREQLRSFERVTPANAPRGFKGELRQYQKEGLGWMAFLRRLGLGGCLADDMGLGKTVQVLALLESRRQQRAGPSLVVVPKSLVFNWIAEAQRFTPRLRVHNHTGTGRHQDPIDPATCDVVISTYGTLRRDAPELGRIEFDYVILDEAQAIKNERSVSAAAARLLRGQHRLALSGTPIENHLGELWSLFEFLNPGLLGKATSFATLRGGLRGTTIDQDTRAVLARALRPFLLRRTKEQVAPELPSRVEQTVFVELEGEQKRLYDALRDRYRRELLERVDRVGMNRARMHVLEALLRLRQLACHPALVDPKRRALPGAKLPLLVATLEEVVAEGHRALVFSQFTSFLALVKERLDRAGIRYEYLDGRTRDRQARVQRFQSDASCPVFLISLRAGGHGLNLTAADYVFILDPWWNPAVEAQAIDRTHRIGQQKAVLAMRLIARDTVEEKVLALQQSKRALADAVLGQDAGLISRISREDLELLLA